MCPAWQSRSLSVSPQSTPCWRPVVTAYTQSLLHCLLVNIYQLDSEALESPPKHDEHVGPRPSPDAPGRLSCRMCRRVCESRARGCFRRSTQLEAIDARHERALQRPCAKRKHAGIGAELSTVRKCQHTAVSDVGSFCNDARVNISAPLAGGGGDCEGGGGGGGGGGAGADQTSQHGACVVTSASPTDITK